MRMKMVRITSRSREEREPKKGEKKEPDEKKKEGESDLIGLASIRFVAHQSTAR